MPLLAEPKPGYIFTHWTEGGTEVSTDPAYTFTSAANRTLVANFIPLPSMAVSKPASDTVTIEWPAGATSWLLEESADLSPGSWVESTRPFIIEGPQKKVIVTGPSGTSFFRLKHP